MKKFIKYFLSIIVLLTVNTYVNAEKTYINDNIYTYYYGQSCSHCITVENYLKKSWVDQRIHISPKEVTMNAWNREELFADAEELGISTSQIGTPFIIVREVDGNAFALMGEKEAMKHFEALEKEIKNLNTNEENNQTPEGITTTWTVENNPENTNTTQNPDTAENNSEGEGNTTNSELPAFLQNPERSIDTRDLQNIFSGKTASGDSVILYTDPQGKELFVAVNNIYHPIFQTNAANDGGSTTYTTPVGELVRTRDITERKIISTTRNGEQVIEQTNKRSEQMAPENFLAVMIPAALADSINPCAFAVMLLLLTTILSKTKDKKKAFISGLMFSLAIFITYFLLGIGVLKLLWNVESLFRLKWIVGIVGILIGLANLKDYFRYGKGFVMEVPLAWRPTMMKIIKGVTSPRGAFFIGVVVSLFLLPCSSGPYLTILGFLSAESQSLNIQGYMYLTIYNLIFILPMIIIAFLIGFGYSTAEKIWAFKNKNTKLIHLIMGLLMLALGIYVIGTLYGW